MRMYNNNKTIILDKNFYDRNNCKFVFCNSCYWCATNLKAVYDINKCVVCGKSKVYVRNI